MLNHYQQEIVKITNCPPTDAAQLEEFMRQKVSKTHNGCLDGLSARQFVSVARFAREMQLFMRTPEGVEMCERIEREILMLD